MGLLVWLQRDCLYGLKRMLVRFQRIISMAVVRITLGGLQFV